MKSFIVHQVTDGNRLNLLIKSLSENTRNQSSRVSQNQIKLLIIISEVFQYQILEYFPKILGVLNLRIMEEKEYDMFLAVGDTYAGVLENSLKQTNQSDSVFILEEAFKSLFEMFREGDSSTQVGVAVTLSKIVHASPSQHFVHLSDILIKSVLDCLSSDRVCKQPFDMIECLLSLCLVNRDAVPPHLHEILITLHSFMDHKESKVIKIAMDNFYSLCVICPDEMQEFTGELIGIVSVLKTNKNSNVRKATMSTLSALRDLDGKPFDGERRRIREIPKVVPKKKKKRKSNDRVSAKSGVGNKQQKKTVKNSSFSSKIPSKNHNSKKSDPRSPERKNSIVVVENKKKVYKSAKQYGINRKKINPAFQKSTTGNIEIFVNPNLSSKPPTMNDGFTEPDLKKESIASTIQNEDFDQTSVRRDSTTKKDSMIYPEELIQNKIMEENISEITKNEEYGRDDFENKASNIFTKRNNSRPTNKRKYEYIESPERTQNNTNLKRNSSTEQFMQNPNKFLPSNEPFMQTNEQYIPDTDQYLPIPNNQVDKLYEYCELLKEQTIENKEIIEGQSERIDGLIKHIHSLTNHVNILLNKVNVLEQRNLMTNQQHVISSPVVMNTPYRTYQQPVIVQTPGVVGNVLTTQQSFLGSPQHMAINYNSWNAQDSQDNMIANRRKSQHKKKRKRRKKSSSQRRDQSYSSQENKAFNKWKQRERKERRSNFVREEREEKVRNQIRIEFQKKEEERLLLVRGEEDRLCFEERQKEERVNFEREERMFELQEEQKRILELQKEENKKMEQQRKHLLKLEEDRQDRLKEQQQISFERKNEEKRLRRLEEERRIALQRIEEEDRLLRLEEERRIALKRKDEEIRQRRLNDDRRIALEQKMNKERLKKLEQQRFQISEQEKEMKERQTRLKANFLLRKQSRSFKSNEQLILQEHRSQLNNLRRVHTSQPNMDNSDIKEDSGSEDGSESSSSSSNSRTGSGNESSSSSQNSGRSSSSSSEDIDINKMIDEILAIKNSKILIHFLKDEKVMLRFKDLSEINLIKLLSKVTDSIEENPEFFLQDCLPWINQFILSNKIGSKTEARALKDSLLKATMSDPEETLYPEEVHNMIVEFLAELDEIVKQLSLS